MGTADAGGLEDLVVDFVAKQRGADQRMVAVAKNMIEVGDVACAPAGDALRVQVQAGGGAVARALNFILLINHRRTPGFAVVDKQGGIGGDFPEG